MKSRDPLLFFGLIFGLVLSEPAMAAGAGTDEIRLPEFPLPAFAMNKYGVKEAVGVVRLLRELHKGGVSVSNQFEASDNEYAIIASSSLPLLAAWLEVTCKSVGLDLAQARSGSYDGSVYARLLQVATSIATARKVDATLAMPIGVMICQRRRAWGALPGDGQRDAYVVIATERGFLVYDPPTRQCSTLADYPNHDEVVIIRL